jgi:sec-independent protein translocase protein TatC
MQQQVGSEHDDSQPLVEHLTELRKRLIFALAGIFVGFFVCWSFSEIIFDIVRAPIRPHLPSDGLVFTAPMDKFMAHIKVSFLASIVVTSPFWVYQLWAFISPALYKEEKAFGFFFIFFGSSLFTAGVSFVYFIVYPLAFKFLMTFAGDTDKPMITISEYLSFFITTTLVFGMAFQMPLIFSILAKLGLVSSKLLTTYRRHAIVLLAAMSAVVTPPDVISMILMMIPMVGLYELSIFLVRMTEKKD